MGAIALPAVSERGDARSLVRVQPFMRAHARRSAWRLAVGLIACATLGGCGSAVTVSRAATLDGTWRRVEGIPGNSEEWDLTVTGSAISGTGTWTGEACCSGPLTVSGRLSSDSIHVIVSLTTTGGAPVPPRQYRFDGVLLSPTEMAGVANGDTSSNGRVVLDKVQNAAATRRSPSGSIPSDRGMD